MINHRDILSARKLRKAGFQNSLRTVLEAKRAGLSLSYVCAFLEKESAKGLNVFGHDPVKNPVKGGAVTKARYLRYKNYRKAGLGMQGVGPLQLTWYTYQDAADQMGGCWKPQYNMRVGFQMIAGLLKSHKTVHDAVAAWNGAGPAAEAYAKDWETKQAHWHKYLTS